MPKHKLKKFERSQTPPNFRIGEKDIRIIRELADYKFLDAKQIAALHPEIAERTLKRRLQFLFHAGFLERPIHQFSYFKPSNHIVYALGKEGAKLVFPDKKMKSPSAGKTKETGPVFLWHSLMISNFRAVLSLALRNAKESKLARWQAEDLADEVYAEGEKLPLAPDAFFTLEDRDDYLHFFLEADRSTMARERFLKKMRGYWQWWREEGHKRKFGISRFRVLTVAVSEERKENLREITKQADEGRRGSEMFLFACEKAYDLEKPESILRPIWQSPKDSAHHHILE